MKTLTFTSTNLTTKAEAARAAAAATAAGRAALKKAIKEKAAAEALSFRQAAEKRITEAAGAARTKKATSNEDARVAAETMLSVDPAPAVQKAFQDAEATAAVASRSAGKQIAADGAAAAGPGPGPDQGGQAARHWRHLRRPQPAGA